MGGPDCLVLRADGNPEGGRACRDRLEAVPGQDCIECWQIRCVDSFPVRDRGLQIGAFGDVAFTHRLIGGQVAVVHSSKLVAHCAIDCDEGGWWGCAASTGESAAAPIGCTPKRRQFCVERSRRRNYF